VMPRLLLLNRYGSVCSAAIAEVSRGVVDIREEQSPNSHSRVLAPMVFELLGTNPACVPDAIVVCSGPGSYTGLRIGLSLAKGLAIGWDIPLIALPTLNIMAKAMMLGWGIESDYYLPLIDARRMEVYAACYQWSMQEVLAPSPLILESSCFQFIPEGSRVWVGGDGSDKSLAFLSHTEFVKVNLDGFMDAMSVLGSASYLSGSFSDVAYVETVYLKPFYSPAKKA
jgi:tRNA threonylcarbamoyladenosine biosynthesis protein TsaB